MDGLVIAVFLEAIYVVGRHFFWALTSDAFYQELFRTAWRLPFLAIYLWLYVRFFRKEARRARWNPWLLIIVAASIVSEPLAGFGINVDMPSRLLFLAATPIVALREELFYRAILQTSLARLMPPGAAVLLSAFAFVPYHIGAQPLTAVTIPYIFAAGVLLGVVFDRTRSLLIVTLIHIAYDAAAVLIPEVRVIDDFTAVGISLALLFAALIWWHSERRRAVEGRTQFTPLPHE